MNFIYLPRQVKGPMKTQISSGLKNYMYKLFYTKTNNFFSNVWTNIFTFFQLAMLKFNILDTFICIGHIVTNGLRINKLKSKHYFYNQPNTLQRKWIMNCKKYFLTLSNCCPIEVQLLISNIDYFYTKSCFRTSCLEKHLTNLKQRGHCYHNDFYQTKNLTTVFARKLLPILTYLYKLYLCDFKTSVRGSFGDKYQKIPTIEDIWTKLPR